MKAYSGFQTHSAPSVNLSYSQLCHILSAGIFKTVGVFKTLRNVGQAYSELCHRALLSNNHIYSGPYICRNLAYSESWNIQNFSIFASRRIFGTLSYLRKLTNIQNSGMFKTRQIFRTVSEIQDGAFFVKNNYNYFCNLLLLIILTGF